MTRCRTPRLKPMVARRCVTAEPESTFQGRHSCNADMVRCKAVRTTSLYKSPTYHAEKTTEARARWLGISGRAGRSAKICSSELLLGWRPTHEDNKDYLVIPHARHQHYDFAQSIRDAIQVSKLLQIRYLWVDALCM